MELTIEKRGKSYGKIHQARLKEIRRYLETLTTQEDAEALLVLADALLVYSHSQALLKRSGKELIEWLKTFLDFLHCRDGEVKVAPFQPKNSNSSFLLVNTPDVPYLVDSLKTILQKLPQRAKVISHPVLTIQRSDGLLTSLDKKTVAGPKESFLLVQFEGARDLDTEAIEEDVSRVFLAAQVVGRQYEEMEEKILSLSNLAEDQDQKNFLEWLLNGNFICFGYAAVDASGTNGGATKAEFTETPLGWLPPSLFSKGKGRKALQLTAEAKELFARKNPLVVEVLDEQSPLYQQDNLIYIGFR
ncbi:MAG: NAD-glutamate dehydrogenase, partial [Deltaproteobacteria bacterium]|nr:NAD-glutamate dehydrogenase [Deltaproteobacteria bacterium]